MDTNKNRIEFFRSTLLAIAALAVIAVAGYAWFVNNREVAGGTGAMSVTDYGFELASLGNAGKFDEEVPEEHRIAGDAWSFQEKTGTQTSGNKQEILWSISDDSQIGNAKRFGIRPGSRGTLEFYVIPKQPGELTLVFDLTAIPLQSEKAELEPESIASKLLQGHVLYAYGFGGEKHLLDITDQSFVITFDDCEKDVPKLVSIDWFWPYVWSDAIEDENYGSEIEQMAADHPEYFFYDSNSPGSIVQTRTSSDKILSSYYNQADQYIGEEIAWLYLKLDARIQ